MHIGSKQLAAWSCVVALWAAAASPSAAQETPSTSEVDRLWIPSFSLMGGVMIQTMESAVASRCALGGQALGLPPFPENDTIRVVEEPACSDPDPTPPSGPNDPDPRNRFPGPGPLRPSDSDDEIAVSPLVAGALQLMSPRIASVPFGPRFFVSGELITFFPPRRQIAREGNPARVGFPDGATNAEQAVSIALVGVGSSVESEIKTLGFGARTGLAFPFEFRERRLWLRPSVGWMQYTVDVQGRVTAGIKDDLYVPLSGDLQTGRWRTISGPGIREVLLQGRGEKTFNGIGPGVELELEAGRFGPLGTSVFMGFDAFYMLGDRDVRFSSSVGCPPCPTELVETVLQTPFPPVLRPTPEADIGSDNYTADWKFEVRPWAFRTMLGVRVHWLGR